MQMTVWVSAGGDQRTVASARRVEMKAGFHLQLRPRRASQTLFDVIVFFTAQRSAPTARTHRSLAFFRPFKMSEASERCEHRQEAARSGGGQGDGGDSVEPRDV